MKPPDVQLESEGKGAAGDTRFFVAFPFLVILEALFWGGIFDLTRWYGRVDDNNA